MCKTWLDIRLSDDLNSGDYDGFTSAVFNNKDASRYRKVLKDEYAGRILEPVDVDVLMQVQGINESKLSCFCVLNLTKAFSKPKRRIRRHDNITSFNLG